MINLLLKLVLSSAILIVCDIFSPYSIQFGAFYEAIILGVFIGLINFSIEWLMFARGTFWVTTILDFVISLCVVFFGAMIFDDVYIGTAGALVLAILITLSEFFLHQWLLKNNWGTKLIQNNH